MTIDYSTPSTVQFTMTDYIDKMLKDAPEDMSGESHPRGHNYSSLMKKTQFCCRKPMERSSIT